MQLLLGESEGRVRARIGGLPRGVMAVTVPVRKGGEARLPRDRHRRLRIDEVDLIADGRQVPSSRRRACPPGT